MNRIAFAGEIPSSEEKFNRCYEIIIPENSGRITIGSTKTEFVKSDIIIIPPAVRYSAEGGGNRIHILLEQGLLPIKKPTFLKDDARGGLRHCAEQAVHYFNTDVYGKDLIISALGELLASYISSFCGNSCYSPAVELVLTDLKNNLSVCGYTPEDAIKKIPLSYDYVRKLFKKETGITPHEYLTSLRMNLAVNLLESGATNKFSNYSVAQIAEACGFGEPLYFSRVFKNFYGAAPSDYRKTKL